jgi:uncharacterized protein (TIGR02271 family)
MWPAASTAVRSAHRQQQNRKRDRPPNHGELSPATESDRTQDQTEGSESVITQHDLRTLIGTTAYGNDGEKIGKVGAIYYDDNTNEPRWITVNTGFFGTNESFVPLDGAGTSGDGVTLAYDKAKVKDAPNVAQDGHLSPEEEQRLYEYYGVDYGSGTGTTGTGTTGTGTTGTGTTGTGTVETATAGTGTAGTAAGLAAGGGVDRDRDGMHDGGEGTTIGHDVSGPTTDDAMTRSEEELRVGTETRESGRARLRKHVVTEHERVTVPVSREEVKVEREPITDANRNAAYDGPAISEEEHEVVLREERPVVEKEAVPVERVRLGTETHTTQETVGGEVRKEEIDVDTEDRNLRDR